MYRLVVTDYDGTLCENGKAVSNTFYTKINMLTSRGCLFAIASGRPYNGLKKLVYPIANETVFISDDGAQVMYHNCVIYKKTVEVENAKALSRIALGCGLTPIVALREENRKVTEEKLNLPFFFSSDIFKLIIVKDGKNADEVKNRASEFGCRVCYEDDTYLELCNKDADKGEAVKKLMQKFSVDEDKLAVFGDGVNDIPMLTLTKNRFTTQSGCDEVKKIATVLGSVEKYISDMTAPPKFTYSFK